ncbi:MAG TPA: hypothetical protein VK468_11890 [Pyrinomonadaceae bacterium]|nr:hypothetical protein [Pyrinomonadaceae bacterium]
MKKFLVSTMMFLVVSIGLPLSTDAQTCRRYRHVRRSHVSRNYVRTHRRHYTPRYSTAGYTAYRRPSFYRRHRNIINMAIGTGGGLLLGGLIGGRRGAGIGALAGLGGSALYTYKLRPKRRYYR